MNTALAEQPEASNNEWDGVEKRSYPRFDTDSAFFCYAYDRESGQRLGGLVDLSLGGMQLVSVQPLTVGQRFRVRIAPVDEFEAAVATDLAASCVWVQRDTANAYFSMGFEFADLSEQARHGIESIIAKWC